LLPLIGYTDRLSAAAGERVAFKVSSRVAGPYRASLARVVHADPNPAGPGVKLEDLTGRFWVERPSRVQPIALGSYARVDAAAALRLGGPLTVAALVWPTLARGEQCVVSRWDEAARAGWALFVGPEGVTARVGVAGSAPLVLATGRPLALRRWHRVWLVVDLDSPTLRVGHAPTAGGARHETSTALPPGARLDTAAPLLIGARLAPEPREHFNGKIEDPLLLGVAAPAPEALALDPLLPLDALIAGWDLSQGIEGLDVVDVGPHRLAGTVVNLPTRAVTGARWTGREMCWRHAPREYAAIHFHDDDIYDAGWATDFEFTVPPDLASGAYVMRLAAEGHADEVPFYVRPPRGRPGADVLFVASTYTYQAYANHARGSLDDAFRARIAGWGAYPHNADDHPEYGRSTYNRHRDGSGICYSSRLRPILTFRPRYLTFNDPRGSGLRHYPADTHLLDWLQAHGIVYDVVTDEDVDAEGAALLAPYATVLTGSHPEYHTARTLDAYARYLDGGGRLIYLGGNGFYWRIATSPALRRPRGAPGRGRHPRVGRPGRRVLPRARRRLRRALAAQRPPAATARLRGLLGPGTVRGLVLSPPARRRRPAGGVDPRRRQGRGDRRLRTLRRRRGRLRAGPCRRAARHAGRCRRDRQLGGPRLALRRGARGAALAPLDGHRRSARSPAAGRHDLRRAAGRRRGLRCRPSPSVAASRTTPTTTTSRAFSRT
jgi:N,N-dimethylformamidase